VAVVLVLDAVEAHDSVLRPVPHLSIAIAVADSPPEQFAPPAVHEGLLKLRNHPAPVAL
jgi:hypothetical protein